jgi:hypothetical protein
LWLLMATRRRNLFFSGGVTWYTPGNAADFREEICLRVVTLLGAATAKVEAAMAAMFRV